MKVLKEKKVVEETVVEEEENEGLLALLGKQVTLFCAVYIYTGKLVGVNKTCVKLENPKIVYETGSFTSSDFKDAQRTRAKVGYVQLSMLEYFEEF